MTTAHNINIEEVYRVISYNPETGVFTWAVNEGRKVKGRVINGVKVKYNKEHSVKLSRIAWAIMYKTQPPEVIDHKDGNPANNKFENLRGATHRLNQYNKVKIGGGVVHRRDTPRTKPYRARIRLPNGSRKNIGDFKTREEAEEAYRSYAAKIQGEFQLGVY